ncbi:MAG TPA: hypothetical protein GXZ61_00955 [Clostridiales bacterium]|jgi:inhibitor of cysteine peptidase|nr:hypothetical protein [Clostridiales bacterium]
MKDYKEITAAVLARKAEYMRKKRARSRATIAAACVLCLALVVSVTVKPLSVYFNAKSIENLPKSVSNYNELYSAISAIIRQNRVVNDLGGWKGTVGEAAPNAPEAPQDSDGRQNNSKDYSDTNLQVAGVQEADIIKTDGDYIYAISSNNLYIVEVDGDKLELVSKVEDWDDYNTGYYEMYITENRIIALKYYYDDSYYGYAVPEIAWDGMFWMSSTIGVDIFDISDKTEPKLINSIGQSGYYVSSRMIDDTLYLVSNHVIYSNIDKSKPETFVPKTFDNDGEYLINPGDIILNTDYTDGYSTQYLVLAGIDTSGDGEIVSSKAMFGFGSSIYASNDNIYIPTYTQIKEGEMVHSATKLFRFSIDEGKIELAAEGVVKGNILNQFSMDEYNGNFRIVTTLYSYKDYPTDNGEFPVSSSDDSGQSNELYVLDSDLNIIGKIENLAKGERVYSVRFMGDIAYFVTYEQIDPLFAVDLKNPKSPTLLSALKIPGFSQYLHPYGEGLLFGLGTDADMEGRASGMKLSMFDVSDPRNVVEKHKLALTNLWSEAQYNHKAILINAERNIIAFATDLTYYVYSYSDETGFKQEAVINLADDVYYGYSVRGLYIGEYMYISAGNTLNAYSMTNYERVATLKYYEERPGTTLPSGEGKQEPDVEVTPATPTIWSFETIILDVADEYIVVESDYDEFRIRIDEKLTRIYDENGELSLDELKAGMKIFAEISELVVHDTGIAEAVANIIKVY